jgi:hypothetical protein
LVIPTDLWNTIEKEMGHAPIMGVPARDIVFFTSSENTAGIVEMRKKVSEIYDSSDHPISKVLYIWKDESWVIYK